MHLFEETQLYKKKSDIYNQLWVLYTEYMSPTQVTKALHKPTEHLSNMIF